MPLDTDQQATVNAGHKMEELLEHSSFKLYLDVLETIIQAKVQLSSVPLASSDDALSRNALLGTIAGLRLAKDLPSHTVSAMKQLLEAEAKVSEADAEEENGDE